MFKNIGAAEVIIIVLVLLLLFGSNKVPDITRGLINSIKSFRSAYKDDDEDAKKKDTK